MISGQLLGGGLHQAFEGFIWFCLLHLALELGVGVASLEHGAVLTHLVGVIAETKRKVDISQGLLLTVWGTKTSPRARIVVGGVQVVRTFLLQVLPQDPHESIEALFGHPLVNVVKLVTGTEANRLLQVSRYDPEGID